MNSFPSPQSLTAPGSENTSASRAARAQPTVWGPPSQQPPSRRGLAPLSTNLPSNPVLGPSFRRATASSSPGPQNQLASSPLGTTFSSVLASSNRLNGSRNPSSGSSTTSPWNLFQAGSQQSSSQPGQSLTSPRTRTLPSTSSSSHLASNTATASASQGGGGGSGLGGGTGNLRGAGTFSPPLPGTNISSPTGFTSEKSTNLGSGSGPSAAGQSSLSKISVAQVLLLLDSISEKEGKAKWESKADQIRKVGHPSPPPSISPAPFILLTSNIVG
jgi:CCR4-NOT transcription complex subunit 1